ncbi:MAG: tetratricopeptide repeat protein [Planctomycetota bacterium]|jgi:tetratricopeptide (TPR) repeat protein
MEIEQNQDILEERSDNQESADAELFTGPVNEELSDRDIFAGDEDFYQRLVNQDSTQNPDTKSHRAETGLGLPQNAQIQNKFLPILQKILAVSITVIAVILLYAVLEPFIIRVTNRPPSPPAPQVRSTLPPVEVSIQPGPEQIQKSEPATSSTEPVSLKFAQDLYLQKDYEQAYAVYDNLRQRLPDAPEEELMKDFLQLKIALCMKALSNTKGPVSDPARANDSDQADQSIRTLLQSRSPVIKMMANYYMSHNELQKKHYLKAQTRAYQTIALMDIIDSDNNWIASLRPDCHFLVAESLTRHTLSLCDADKDLPPRLWSGAGVIDPFTNLNEEQLRSLLSSGLEKFSKSLLSPKFQNLDRTGTSSRWSVVCQGASIDELLARFAANTGLNIAWNFADTPDTEVENAAVRKRLTSLYMPKATTQQFIKVAAGHVGLLAQLNGSEIINIFNPADYTSLSEHITLLTEEAVSLWQIFSSVFHSDKRTPNVHYALALLQTQRGRATEATAEYKLVANRYAHSSLAPHALLQSSKIKTNLRDFSGARRDLKQLVEQYPDSELSSNASMYLAEATMKAGLSYEAGKLYGKVYHMSLSLESQFTSAFGAGECFYDQKDYEESAKWLTRYINLDRDNKSKNLYLACFLLGKCNLALGKIQQACDAFEAALGGPDQMLTSKEIAEAISALVEAKIQQENFIEALAILDNAPPRQFTEEESIGMLLLRTRVLRAMGLIDKAIAAIGDRAQYTLDIKAKARTSLELAKCHMAKENLELAHKELAEILMLVEPGPLSHEIALQLADVCLKMGHNAQTISICSQLLDLGPSEKIKQMTLNTLSVAYRRQNNYDKAALALLGKWNTAKGKRTPDYPAATDQVPQETKQIPIEQGS